MADSILGFNRATTTEGEEGTCMTRRIICGGEKSLKSSHAGFEAFAAKSAQRVHK
jgi:hypothetical protein